MRTTLNFEKAREFRNDYLQIVGKSFYVKGKLLKVTFIDISETTDGGYIPVVHFEIINDFEPIYQLDLFLKEVNIKIDWTKYHQCNIMENGVEVTEDTKLSGILNRLTIQKSVNGENIVMGRVYYIRKLNCEYQMSFKDASEFDRLAFEPNQNEFPDDEIDKEIRRAFEINICQVTVLKEQFYQKSIRELKRLKAITEDFKVTLRIEPIILPYYPPMVTPDIRTYATDITICNRNKYTNDILEPNPINVPMEEYNKYEDIYKSILFI